MDYAFLTQDDDLVGRKVMETMEPEKVKATVLVCHDSKSGGIKAHVVKSKGIGDSWIAGRIIKDLEDFGYGGCAIKIKCDQEPAIVDLQRTVGNQRRGKTVPVNSPVGDSQSNGKVENAIKRSQAGIRTLKDATEAEIGTKINTGHPLFPWLVEWAADLVTRYTMNEAGRTAIQEIRGSRSSRPIAKFGEKIFCMPLKISTKPVPKMQERFHEGIFLGMRMRLDEIIVGTADGVIKARTIRRRPKGEQWSAEELKNMKGTPSMPVPGVQSDNITSRVGREAEDEEEGRPQVEEEPNEDGDVQQEPVTREKNWAREEPMLRKMYVRRSDIVRFKGTPGCPGCKAIEEGARPKPHNDRCRARIRQELEKDEGEKERLQQEERRVKRRTGDPGQIVEDEMDTVESSKRKRR